MSKKPKTIRIHFEDHGQDFLTWDVVPKDEKLAEIVDCKPFQRGIWTKNHITNFDELEEFGTVKFSMGTGHPVYTMNYPIEKIEDVTELVVQEKAEAEEKAQAEREKKQQEQTLKTQD